MTDTYIVNIDNDTITMNKEFISDQKTGIESDDVSHIINYLLLDKENCNNIYSLSNKYKILIYISSYIVFSCIALFVPLVILDQYLQFALQLGVFISSIVLNTFKLVKITVAQKFYYNNELFCIYLDKKKYITVYDAFIKFLSGDYWLDLKGINLDTTLFFTDDTTNENNVNSYKCMKTVYFILLLLLQKKV